MANGKIADRALGFTSTVKEPLLLADQDALNAVVDNWYELDYRWNVQLTIYNEITLAKMTDVTDLTDRLIRQRADLYRGAAVLHFAGFPKPWQPWCTSPGMMLWARSLMRSGWYTPIEFLSWWLPWLGKRAVDARRRAKVGPPLPDGALKTPLWLAWGEITA